MPFPSVLLSFSYVMMIPAPLALAALLRFNVKWARPARPKFTTEVQPHSTGCCSQLVPPGRPEHKSRAVEVPLARRSGTGHEGELHTGWVLECARKCAGCWLGVRRRAPHANSTGMPDRSAPLRCPPGISHRSHHVLRRARAMALDAARTSLAAAMTILVRTV